MNNAQTGKLLEMFTLSSNCLLWTNVHILLYKHQYKYA